MHRPRPVTEALPLLRARGCGEGRGSHPAALAVALRMSIRRWSVVWLTRNWMGSAPADAAASFISPSSAKFCWRCPLQMGLTLAYMPNIQGKVLDVTYNAQYSGHYVGTYGNRRED